MNASKALILKVINTKCPLSAFPLWPGVYCTYTVPLPLGRPRALRFGLPGEDGVEGSTEDRKLEAGDGGTEE